MAELSREHLIEIRIGSGDPPTMRVKPGEPVGPMVVGSAGAWSLGGPGVAPEHAELYFDGSQLFLRSISPAVPAVVQGRPLPAVWTPLEPPCEIALGGARLWFGPDPAKSSLGRLNPEQLLEDDDNVATKVADQQQQQSWGNIGAMVHRGMEMARSGANARPPPPEPPPPPPVPSFWPGASGKSAPPPAAEIGAPSQTTRKDDSGMTRIEPVQEVERRRETSMSSGRRYPMGDLSASGSNYPRAGHASGSAALSASGSHHPRVVPGDDGRPTLGEPIGYGSTEVIQSSPMPQHPMPPSSGGVPMFGAPPPPAPPSVSPPPGVLPPPPMDYSRFTGTHPQVSLPPARQDQSISVEGLSRMEPGAKKSAWQELSGPKRVLVLLSPLLVASVLVLFMGEELGLEPKPRRPVAKAQPSAGPSAAPAMGTAAPTASPTAPSTALPSANAGPPEPPAPSTSAAPPEPPEPPEPVPPPRPTARPKSAVAAKTDGSKSLQRLAADAVAAGSFARAAELYEQLAKENPGKPAYAEAAAIMREKSGQK